MKTQEKVPKYYTVDEFVKIYSRALKEYLSTRITGPDPSHVVDLATENAAFAEAFYIIAESV